MAMRYRNWLIIGFLAGLGLGLLGYLRYGPMYEASTRILVRQPTAVPNQEVGQVVREGRGEHVALIMSEAIVGKAVEQSELDKLPSMLPLDDPKDSIVSKLTVRRSAGQDRSFINLLELRYLNRRAEDSKVVIQAVVDAYGQYLKETASEQGGEATEKAKAQLAEIRKQEADAYQAYIEFRKSAPLTWKVPPGVGRMSTDVVDVYSQRVQEIERERQKAIVQRADLLARLSTLRSAMQIRRPVEEMNALVRQLMLMQGTGATENTAGLGTTQIDRSVELDQQLLPLLNRELELSMDYGDDLPELRAVREKIRMTIQFYAERGVGLPREVADRAGTGLAPRGQSNLAFVYEEVLKLQLETIAARLDELDAQYDSAEESARDFAVFHAKDEFLNSELIRIRKLLEAAENRYTQLSVVSESDSYQMKQIDPVRTELSMKRVIKFLMSGGIFGTLSMLGLLYFRELRDTSLRNVEDVRNRLPYPVLGGVPEFNPERESHAATPDQRALDRSLVYVHQPDSPAAESYRAVRTALFASAATNGKTAFMVTSPEPGDGKSTFIANLGVAMAQAGKRVLIVDADLRRSRIHDLFRVRHGIGTADVLGGEIDLVNAVQTTTVQNLSVLSSGGTPFNPAELLSSARLGDLLRAARAEFDFVLVDSPPLLVVSDPCIIGPQTDGVLLTVRLQKNKAAAVSRTAELIETHGLDVFGTVVNALPMDEEEEYYTANYEAPRAANRGPVLIGR